MEWAIASATFLGPIIAVLITRWQDRRVSARDRRMLVFRMLMGTRRSQMSPEHVAALNLIEVEFHKHEGILNAWKEYQDHLSTQVPPEQLEIWGQKSDKLFGKLLTEMADVLGYRVTKLSVFQGGYAPRGWLTRDALMRVGLDYLDKLSKHQATLPVTAYDQAAAGAKPDNTPSS